MFECFSENARRAAFFSRFEAPRVGQQVIGTERLLLLGINATFAPADDLVAQLKAIVSSRWPRA